MTVWAHHSCYSARTHPPTSCRTKIQWVAVYLQLCRCIGIIILMWIKVNLLLPSLRACCSQAVEIRRIYLRDNFAIRTKHSIWRHLVFLIYVLVRFLDLHHARSEIHLGRWENFGDSTRTLSYRRLDTVGFDAAVRMIALEKSLILLELFGHSAFDHRTILRKITLGIEMHLQRDLSIIRGLAIPLLRIRLYHHLATMFWW